MDYDTRFNLVQRIVAGYQIIEIQNKVLRVNDPNIFHLYEADNFYKKMLEKFQFEDFPSFEQTEIILRDRGILIGSSVTEIESLQKQIKELEASLPKLEFKSTEKKITKQSIEILQGKIQKLNSRKNSLIFFSAEYLAKIEKFRYLLCSLAFYKDQPLWSSYDNLLKDDDRFVNNLIHKVFFEDQLGTKELRELARSEPWRNIWLAATKVSNLFNRSISELTDLQRELVIWSMIYDSVYESADTPSEDVIDNDILLDGWFKNQHEKRQKNRNKESADHLLSNNPKIRDAQEVCLMVDTPEDANKVYNLNDQTSKQKITANFDAVQEKGILKECHLPTVQKDLQMQYNRMLKDRMNEVAKG